MNTKLTKTAIRKSVTKEVLTLIESMENLIGGKSGIDMEDPGGRITFNLLLPSGIGIFELSRSQMIISGMSKSPSTQLKNEVKTMVSLFNLFISQKIYALES